MKLRNGFVSNSSSSSFIIMHHAEVKTVADAEELLPECIESFRYKQGYGDNAKFEIYTRQQVAEWIFRDMKKLSVEELKAFHLSNGRALEERDYYDSEDSREFTWEEFYSDVAGLNSGSLPEVTEENKEETARKHFHFYSVGYSDECSWGNFMEHQVAPMVSIKQYSHH